MTRSVSFGGGVNSTALCIGLVERGERPEFILFADTGNEFPETYQHIHAFSDWLTMHDFPRITFVHRAFLGHASLERECYNLKTLPSKAFGYSGCSVKWKRQPMDKYLKTVCASTLKIGSRIERLIGIDFGEQHRGKIEDDECFTYRFPLIEWRWSREECVEAIQRHGVEVPRKSACFFCPSSTKKEVLALASERPELFRRGVAIERQAEGLEKVRGLGRHWSWEELVASANPESLRESEQLPCACFDGTEE